MCKDEMNIILFLLPFYIIRYEKQVKEIDEDDAIFQGLMEEYRVIEGKLEKELLYEGKETEYRDLIGLIGRIADYIFRESSQAKKGIGEIMGGQVLELESERLLREGRKVGREEGRAAGMAESSCASAIRMLQTGKYAIEEISRISGLTMEKIAEIKKAKNL